MSIIIPANSAAGGGLGYQVANGVRFDDGSSSNFSDGSAPNGNRQKFTWSAWFKRSSVGATQILASSSYSGSDEGYLFLSGGGILGWQSNNSGDGNLSTAMLWRDLSAWYHVVFSVDTTQSTATNRIKLYVNGSQYTWDGSNTTQPNLNQSLYFNVGGSYNTYIGRRAGGDYFDGYMSEIVFIDNAQLAADSFGEFDSDSGAWKPLESVADLTFGTSGYYLNFQNSGALGTDVSGVGNSFTANNLAAIDQTTDTCTNNFATVNGLDNFYEASTFSEGNCKIVTEASLYSYNTSTIGLTQGKWYCEVYIETSPHPSTKDSMIGIAGRMSEGNDNFLGQFSDTYGIYGGNGNIYNDGPTSYGVTQTTNDIVGIYMDLDNNKLYFAKNGALMNSGTGFNLLASNLTTAGAYFMVAADYGNGYQGTYRLNFGNPIYALTSANTDVNGYGSFEYDPSSGTFDGASKDFLAICTNNLSEVLS